MGSILGTTFRQNVRLGYLVQISGLNLAMFLFQVYIGPKFTWLQRVGVCTQNYLSDFQEEESCIGSFAIYRLSASLMLLHVFTMLACLERGAFAKTVNEGCWLFKIFILIGMFIGSLWIPNGYFVFYLEIAEWASLVYLLAQLVLIIDFAFQWSGSWFQRAEEGNNFYVACLWVFTIFFYLSWIVLIFFMFRWFWSNQCLWNNFLLISLLILLFLVSFLNVSGINSSGSILKASFMMVFITIQVW